MKKLIFCLFLTSCITPNVDSDMKSKNLDFDRDLTFNEFSILVKQYSEINPYPIIKD